MKKLFSGFFLFILLSGCSVMSGKPKVLEESPGKSQNLQACFLENCFSVEIADDDKERRKGLMYRKQMADDAGMLFIFDDMRKRRKFRMKNTKIPLDMIWLDNNQNIVYIEENVQPCKKDPCPTYGPIDIESKYVIELNAGMIKKGKIEIGRRVDLSSDFLIKKK